MAEDTSGMGKGLVMGFLAGTIVGATIALLYAPKSGRELRENLKHRTDELKGQAEEYLKVARSKAIDAVNEGKQRSDRLVTDAKKKAESILGDADKLMADIRERSGEETGKVKAAFRAGVEAYKGERSKS